MSDSEHDQADPFELRLQFSDMLRRLTASTESLSRAARFAAQWKSHADVLYAVLLESMESAHVNQRLNLFHLCDHICMATLRLKFDGYAKKMIQDLPRLITLVCGAGSQLAAANVGSVRKVLGSWRKKGVLDDDLFASLMGILASRGPGKSISRHGPSTQTSSLAESVTPSVEVLSSRTSSSSLTQLSKPTDDHEVKSVSKDRISSDVLSELDLETSASQQPSAASLVSELGANRNERRGGEVSRAEIVRRMEEDRERVCCKIKLQ
jgi:hypothetical protein